MNPASDRGRPLVSVVLGVLLVGAALWWWSLRGSENPVVDMTKLAASLPSTTAPAADFPAIEDSAIRDPDTRTRPAPGTLEVVGSIPHDDGAFTQGLEFDGAALYEGTGLRGASTLREINPVTGATIRTIDLPTEVFGEGITIVGDELIQLTWTSGVAYRWDVATFEPLGTFTYGGEGWGICDTGSNLIMSDGSADLTIRRADDFTVLDTIRVTFNDAPVTRLNELECVGDVVWANIWQTPLIIEIDQTSGDVLTVIDASALRPPSTVDDDSAVLNGIAYDASTDTFLLSGKLWPTTYRVRLGGA